MDALKFARCLMRLPITFFRCRNLSTLWRLSSICFCLCFRTASASAMLCAVNGLYPECFVSAFGHFPLGRKIKMLQVLKTPLCHYNSRKTSARTARSKCKQVQRRVPETIYTTDTGEAEHKLPSVDRFLFQAGISVARPIERGSSVFCDHTIQAGC